MTSGFSEPQIDAWFADLTEPDGRFDEQDHSESLQTTTLSSWLKLPAAGGLAAFLTNEFASANQLFFGIEACVIILLLIVLSSRLGILPRFVAQLDENSLGAGYLDLRAPT